MLIGSLLNQFNKIINNNNNNKNNFNKYKTKTKEMSIILQIRINNIKKKLVSAKIVE